MAERMAVEQSERIYRGDCGAVVVLVEPCPDADERPFQCACGAEMCRQDQA